LVTEEIRKMKKIALFVICIMLATSLMGVFPIENVTAAPVVTLKYSKNPGVGSTAVGPLVADVNNDGKMEIIKTGANGIALLDGATGTVIKINTAAMYNDHCPAEIIDLNKDGDLEVITSHGTGTWALHGNDISSTYWYNAGAPLANKYCVAGDIGTTSGNPHKQSMSHIG